MLDILYLKYGLIKTAPDEPTIGKYCLYIMYIMKYKSSNSFKTVNYIIFVWYAEYYC